MKTKTAFKEVKLYVCEKCGYVSDNQKWVSDCEQLHTMPEFWQGFIKEVGWNQYHEAVDLLTESDDHVELVKLTDYPDYDYALVVGHDMWLRAGNDKQELLALAAEMGWTVEDQRW